MGVTFRSNPMEGSGSTFRTVRLVAAAEVVRPTLESGLVFGAHTIEPALMPASGGQGSLTIPPSHCSKLTDVVYVLIFKAVAKPPSLRPGLRAVRSSTQPTRYVRALPGTIG